MLSQVRTPNMHGMPIVHWKQLQSGTKYNQRYRTTKWWAAMICYSIVFPLPKGNSSKGIQVWLNNSGGHWQELSKTILWSIIQQYDNLQVSIISFFHWFIWIITQKNKNKNKTIKTKKTIFFFGSHMSHLANRYHRKDILEDTKLKGSNVCHRQKIRTKYINGMERW